MRDRRPASNPLGGTATLSKQRTPSRKTQLPTFAALRPARISTDSLSDCSPANGSSTLSLGLSVNDWHEASAATQPRHINSGPSIPITLAPRGTAGGRGMQSKIPSRHGSLENLANAGAVTRAVYSDDTALSTAPPPRLSRRATVSETTSPSTAALASTAGATPTSRYLSTPPQTTLAVARLRQQWEAEGSIGRSTSPSQDQPPAVNPSVRRGLPAATGALATILPEDVRRGSLASQMTVASSNGTAGASLSGEFLGNPVTLIVNPAGGSGSMLAAAGGVGGGGGTVRPLLVPGSSSSSTRAPAGSGEAALSSSSAAPACHATASETSAREERVARRHRSSLSPGVLASDSACAPPLLVVQPGLAPTHPPVAPRRRPSDSAREPSTSPSADSVAGEDGDVARGHHRSGSFAASVENGSKSPSTGPKRVHFSFKEPRSDSSILTSSIRVGGEEAAAHTMSRGVTPVAFNTSPLVMELSGASHESSLRFGLSGSDLRGGTGVGGSGVLAGSRPGGSPPLSAVPVPPTLSLRLNVQKGRIEAVSSKPPTAPSDSCAIKAYRPQMPLPKPALKAYSRYAGNAAETSSDDAPAGEGKRGGSTRSAAQTPPVAGRGVWGAMQRTAARFRQRRGSNAAAKAAEGRAVAHRRSSEVMITWSLLSFAALFSFLLIFYATLTD